jgi:hypothetical protein
MRIISHRGNLEGPDPTIENVPAHCAKVLAMGFDVEIDLRVVDGKLMLGHDFPEHEVPEEFLQKEGLWVHCKNLEALEWCIEHPVTNFFWHQADDYTLTSSRWIWAYPGKKLSSKCIAVMPEWGYDGKLEECFAVCTDYVFPKKYDNQASNL